MGFERHRSRTYYYRKRWLNGHVVSEYLGKGERARLAALNDALSRRERLERARRAQAERDEWTAQDTLLDRLEASLRLVTQAYLLTLGYHMHKGQWRRNYHKKNNTLEIAVSVSTTDLTPSEISRLNRLIKKTQMANAEPADHLALRQMHETHPELWRALGDLADLSQRAVLGFGNWLDPGTRLAVEIGTREIKKELGYAQAPVPERLLVDQIVVTWLQLSKTQMKYEGSLSVGVSFQSSFYWERRLSASNARHLRALETLARVRRLAHPDAVQVNIGAQQVNLAASSDNQTMAEQSTDLSDPDRLDPNDITPE